MDTDSCLPVYIYTCILPKLLDFWIFAFLYFKNFQITGIIEICTFQKPILPEILKNWILKLCTFEAWHVWVVCMYIDEWLYVCMSEWMYKVRQAWVCLYQVYMSLMYVHMYVCMYEYVCMHVYMCTCIYIKFLLPCHYTHIWHLSLSKYDHHIANMSHIISLLSRHADPAFLHICATTQPTLVYTSYVTAIYVQNIISPQMSLIYHICSSVHVHVSYNFVSIYASYELNVISNVNTNSHINKFHITDMCPWTNKPATLHICPNALLLYPITVKTTDYCICKI